MAYLLDSNVFIQAKNLHYGFDFCPAFWDWIEAKSREGSLGSITEVRRELEAGEDELADWAKARPTFFRGLDGAVTESLRSVADWASKAGYESAGVNLFFQSADYFLIAHALASGDSVVTHERPSDSVRKIKIPDACIGLNVEFMTPFEMLRGERAKFVLG